MSIFERKIHLVRHGETPWNVQKKMLGRTDIPLNDNGRKQAKELTESLAELPIDIIICSDLSRAVETAEVVRGSRVNNSVRMCMEIK